MSSNLSILGRYSRRMAAGDSDAVYEFFAPEFFSHVTPRVTPQAVGTDIRGGPHCMNGVGLAPSVVAPAAQHAR